MHDGPTSRPSPPVTLEPWLESIDGDSHVLLIAPHGGRAGAATRAILNPKVNDLHTADITRELAARLSATALVNKGMDRNHLDLNRVSQVTANAPWFLAAILERVHAIVARHGRVTILIIHGWNIIEPRVDLGVGLRRYGEELRPPGMARVSASDAFIRGPLSVLIERLRAHGIAATFGMRYPAGGAQNLLQAFSERHLESPVAALCDLAALFSRGQIDAAQLELSVCVRMKGEYRERCIESIAEVFGVHPHTHPESPSPSVRRSPTPKRTPSAKAPQPAAMPTRVGLELFDPIAEIGAMASFDLGAGGVGARIMMLLPGGRVALFTGEGKCLRENHRIRLGPLSLEVEGGALRLAFRGPGVIVPEASNYLSIERALASGWLDPRIETEVRLDPNGRSVDLERMFSPDPDSAGAQSHAVFGPLTGAVRAGDVNTALSGFGRGGVSFTGLGAQRFTSRRMIWACFRAPAPTAMELRAIDSEGEENRSGRILREHGWESCEVAQIEVESKSVAAPPDRIAAEIRSASCAAIVGEVKSFVPLSRPGPDNTRIFTALGFASFRMGDHEGAGMFEYSRRADEVPAAGTEDEESDE